MTDWIVWFVLAGVLVALEMFTGTFYLLMIAIGLAAGGLAALASMGTAVQLAVAGGAGAMATYMLHRSKWGKAARLDAQRDPNVNLDIGQTLVVHEWSGRHGGVRTARVMYRGAMWDVELATHAQPHGQARAGTYVIREVRGNRLIVSEAAADKQ